MPQLVTKVSAPLRKRFNEMSKKLLEHELGHRTIAIASAQDIDAALTKMQAATCKELIDNSREVYDEWIKKGKERRRHQARSQAAGLAHRSSRQEAGRGTTEQRPIPQGKIAIRARQ